MSPARTSNRTITSAEHRDEKGWIGTSCVCRCHGKYGSEDVPCCDSLHMGWFGRLIGWRMYRRLLVVWIIFKEGMDYERKLSGWWVYIIIQMSFGVGLLIGWMVP